MLNRIPLPAIANDKLLKLFHRYALIGGMPLLQRLYPVTDTQLPLIPNQKKSPKLQLLGTGLMNYFAGLQTEVFGTTDLNAVYGGRVVEHLVGQELYASQASMLFKLHFWVREKKQ
ncbi:MAG: AAA family ATPase [uncultured Thiotrichaceae bacterium]|uniref:AAA family ATPase n=1 Tax=uncultured Thiotrichaceae bacterium TaxID=298394 RepID=A0A6S6SKH5_9GAMM|nr:MAG: AAA family ATPase [uncultured Thiotrichaceae bacterium]